MSLEGLRRRVSGRTRARRPLVFALALVGVCACAAVLAWLFDAPLAAAGVLATASPVMIVTLHEALRVLDQPVDDATRRSMLLALVLLLVPIVTLVAIAVEFGEAAVGRLLP